jgi:hypothetical protein
MTLLGQTFQPLGGSHAIDRPLIPEENDAEPAFLPYVMVESEPPPEPEKKQSILGNVTPWGGYRLGGYVKR